MELLLCLLKLTFLFKNKPKFTLINTLFNALETRISLGVKVQRSQYTRFTFLSSWKKDTIQFSDRDW